MKQQNPVFNPTLQGVLSCLDVQLEAELVRYRRQKAKARSQSGNNNANPLAALDLKAFHAQPLREPIAPGFPSGLSASTVTSTITSTVTSTMPPVEPPIVASTARDPLKPLEPTQQASSELHSNIHKWQYLSALASQTAEAQSNFDPSTADFNDINRDLTNTGLAEPDLTNGGLTDSGIDSEDSDLINIDIDDRYLTDFSMIAPGSMDPLAIETLTMDALAIETDLPNREAFTNPIEPYVTESHITDPYVILTETYTPTPINWSAPELSTPGTDPLGGEAEIEIIESLVLPPELSEAELFALGGLSAGTENTEQADWPEYEISDEDNPWPDELDEEPYTVDAALATTFPEALEAQERGGGVDAFVTEAFAEDGDDVDSIAALEVPLTAHEPLEENDVSEENSSEPPLMLPSADHRSPASPSPPRPPLQPGPHHLKPVGLVHPPTEAYLASSEALLDNLDEEDDRQNWPQRLSNLFTPQGIGSALLLIFSALAVSMVLLNPELVSHWKLGRFGGSLPAISPSPEIVLPDPPIVQDVVEEPNPYNLSSQEFLNLDLGNLRKVNPQAPSGIAPLGVPGPSSTVGSSPLGNPGPASSESGTEMFSDLRDSITANEDEAPTEPVFQDPEPRSAPVAVPPPLSASSSPRAPEAAPPAPVEAFIEDSDGSSGSSSSSGSYVVVTPYTSDQLLDQSQAIVPDAYLRNTDQGANIQFGVFSDPDAAAALAEQLQAQGIAVEVIPAEP